LPKLLNKTIKKYGKPEQLLSNNGSEFINKKVKSLLNKEGISFIHGINSQKNYEVDVNLLKIKAI
jgi:hypothetical protein